MIYLNQQEYFPFNNRMRVLPYFRRQEISSIYDYEDLHHIIESNLIYYTKYHKYKYCHFDFEYKHLKAGEYRKPVNGWHIDGSLDLDRRPDTYFVWQLGPIGTETAFLPEPVVDILPQPFELNKHDDYLWEIWEDSPRPFLAPQQHLFAYTSRHLHACRPALEDGDSYFLKITFSDLIKPENICY